MPFSEHEQRISRSVIWRAQREFYASAGMAAWDGVIPEYMTCNCFIAKQYCHVVASYIRDAINARTHSLTHRTHARCLLVVGVGPTDSIVAL